MSQQSANNFYMDLFKAMYLILQSNPLIDSGNELFDRFRDEVHVFLESIGPETRDDVFIQLKHQRFPKKRLSVMMSPASPAYLSRVTTARNQNTTVLPEAVVENELTGIPESSKLILSKVIDEMIKSRQRNGHSCLPSQTPMFVFDPLSLNVDQITFKHRNRLLEEMDRLGRAQTTLVRVENITANLKRMGMVQQYLIFKKGCELYGSESEFRVAAMEHFSEGSRQVLPMFKAKTKWGTFKKAKSRGERILKVLNASGLHLQAEHEDIHWSLLYSLNDEQIDQCVEYIITQRNQLGISADWREQIVDATSEVTYNPVVLETEEEVSSQQLATVLRDIDVADNIVEHNLALPLQLRGNDTEIQSESDEFEDDVYVPPKRVKISLEARAFIDDFAEVSDG